MCLSVSRAFRGYDLGVHAPLDAVDARREPDWAATATARDRGLGIPDDAVSRVAAKSGTSPRYQNSSEIVK